MLLAFVGQVTATTIVPCKMMTQSDNSGMDMAGMDHSAHQMTDKSENPDNSHSDATPDCCKTGTNCSMGSCLSMLSAANDNITKPQTTAQKVFFPTLALISQIPSSLYRPPIFS